MYGTTLHVPGEFFSAGSVSPCDPSAYVAQLKAAMQALRATSPRQNQGHKVYIPSDLMSSTLDINGRKEVITIDRLKSAHVEETPHDPAILLPPPKPVPPAVTVTRSGRQVRPPNYL